MQAHSGTSPTDLRTLLKRAGLRITTARLEVFNNLRKQQGFVRPETLFRLSIEQRQHTNISSIYRALSDLADARIITRARDGEGRHIYAVLDQADALAGNLYLCLDGREPVVLEDPLLRAALEKAAMDCGMDLRGCSLGVFPLTQGEFASAAAQRAEMADKQA